MVGVEFFASHPISAMFLLEVFIGYTITVLTTATSLYMLQKIGIDASDTGFLSLPVFDRMLPTIVSTVLLAPLEEEIVFRGLTSILFGITGIIMGTIVWAAAHLPSRIENFSTYPSSVQKKAAAILFWVYLVYGIYFSWLWIVGAGLIAVLMHFLNNAVAVLATYRRLNSKQTDIFEERAEKEGNSDLTSDMWVDSNPPDEPVYLKPIIEPEFFKVVSDEEGNVSVEVEKRSSTKVNGTAAEETINKKKKEERPSRTVNPPVSEAAMDLHDTRAYLKYYLDKYIQEKYG